MPAHDLWIKRDTDFQAIRRSGRAARGKLVTIRVRATDTPARYGLIVSRRVSQLATVRNQVKRRLRAALAELGRPATGDAVIIAAPSSTTASYAELKDDVAATLAQARADNPPQSR